ncbi:MAG: hypothetical protein MHM6MM_008764 [Cercozoa sp. M6MM]
MWTNWAETVQCHPGHTYEPESVEEVQKLVRSALRQGERLRCVGAGHSPSDIACSDNNNSKNNNNNNNNNNNRNNNGGGGGVDAIEQREICPRGSHVSLRRMRRLVAVKRDLYGAVVTVEGGMHLHEVVQQLRTLGLAMPALGSIMAQTVAGAIATGTHSTGAHFGCLSSKVRGVVLVDGTGRVRSVGDVSVSGIEHLVSSDDDGVDTDLLLRALKCHLGSLGVLVRVSLRVEKHFRLHAIQVTHGPYMGLDKWTGGQMDRRTYGPLDGCVDRNRTHWTRCCRTCAASWSTRPSTRVSGGFRTRTDALCGERTARRCRQPRA